MTQGGVGLFFRSRTYVSGRSNLSSILIQTAVQKAGPGLCRKCRPTAPMTLVNFGKELAAEVDRAIETVSGSSTRF